MAAFFGGKKRAEALYDEMRAAINDNNHQRMREIIGNKDYMINRVGGKDKRTALHTATMEQNRETLAILLGHQDIDTNVKTSNGLTPLLLAAAKGKMVSLEVLLADSRVNDKVKDIDDQSVLELVEALGKRIKIHQAKELLGKRYQTLPREDGKLAILIGNYNYKEESGLANLAGARNDLEAMRMKLSADGYRIEVIENSADILEDMEKVMTKPSDHSVNLLQVLYVGE